MMKINKRIEIVASTMPGLSSMGASTRKQLHAVLAQHYQHVTITLINSMPDLFALGARSPDMVFLGMKFIPKNSLLGLADPNKVWVSEYLERKGIAYTGSSAAAIELELSKELGKQRVLDAGLPTANFIVIKVGQAFDEADVTLKYPLFVKPTNRGGGVGVDTDSLVHDFYQLRNKVKALAVTYDADAMVEEYLPGREFSVGILRQLHTSHYDVMPLELVAPADSSGQRFLTGAVKSADTEKHKAVADPILRTRINILAIRAFHALGAQDYGRIDIRLDALGNPQFLEANLLPSLLAGYGNFPKTCMLNMQFEHEAVIMNIVDLGFARKRTVTDVSTNTYLSRNTPIPHLRHMGTALDTV